METQIEISKTPENICYDDLEINQGQCFINSYRVAVKYPDVEIVEGLIIVIDNDNNARPMAHIWNKSSDTYFDITNEKIWTGREELRKTREIKYFPLKIHNSKDFRNGDTFEFCEETYENIAAVNQILKTRRLG